MSNRKSLHIGLIGFGVVGEGIYHVISNTPSLNAVIQKIGIKHIDKKRNAPAELFTTDVGSIINDPAINVIVELIDDAEVAYDIAVQSFKNNKSVISANKKMIANHLDELIQLSKSQQVSFLYEGAVCGSIPVIRNLEEYYDNDLLQSFSGIVNGSTNYILTKMIEQSWTYVEALKQAQDLGFAESNPDLDVEGIDAVNKLCIVLKHTYGIAANPEDILVKGITSIKADDVKISQEKSYKIKLVAQAIHLGDQQVAAWVLPTFVSENSKLYNISNEYNGVVIGSKLADEQFLSGKGAGRYPTSSAVLSDISALQYGYNYEYRKSSLDSNYALTKDVLLRIYISTSDLNKIDTKAFDTIEERFESGDYNYIVGSITLENIQLSAWIKDKEVSTILINVQHEADDVATSYERKGSESYQYSIH